MSKTDLSNLNGIIVLINGKPITNKTLKNDIDRLIIIRNTPKLNTKAHNYLKLLINMYHKESKNAEKVEFIESIKEIYPNGIITKTINKKPLDDFETIETIEIKPIDNKSTKIDDLEKRFKANQQKLRELRKKLGVKPKNKTEILKKPIKKAKSNKELTYNDIKPYLTKRQLLYLKETTEKDGITYKTILLTQNKEYFDKQLHKEKFDSTRKYLGNKHIKSQIGLIYRLFVEKTDQKS